MKVVSLKVLTKLVNRLLKKIREKMKMDKISSKGGNITTELQILPDSMEAHKLMLQSFQWDQAENLPPIEH